MGDLARRRLWDNLLGWKTDLLLVELMPLNVEWQEAAVVHEVGAHRISLNDHERQIRDHAGRRMTRRLGGARAPQAMTGEIDPVRIVDGAIEDGCLVLRA
jgi:hypothetical protein